MLFFKFRSNFYYCNGQDHKSMKRQFNKLPMVVILFFLAFTSCKAENKEKSKREVVKSESSKEEVSTSESQHAKPILIIGTASILYKFWFSSAD